MKNISLIVAVGLPGQTSSGFCKSNGQCYPRNTFQKSESAVLKVQRPTFGINANQSWVRRYHGLRDPFP